MIIDAVMFVCTVIMMGLLYIAGYARGRIDQLKENNKLMVNVDGIIKRQGLGLE